MCGLVDSRTGAPEACTEIVCISKAQSVQLFSQRSKRFYCLCASTVSLWLLHVGRKGSHWERVQVRYYDSFTV